MRIASAGIIHETNTFATEQTTMKDFVRDSGGDSKFPSEEIPNRFLGSATIHGGYLEASNMRGVDLIPTLVASATPGGTVQESAYQQLKSLLIKRIRDTFPVDGILLDLHGAMVTETNDDAEGDIITAVRSLVGPSTPIVVTLDLHANITLRMAQQADVLIGYDTYPHIDMGERGVEAFNLVEIAAAGKIQPTMAYHQLPLLTMPPPQCTLRQPMQKLVKQLHNIEIHPDVLTATLSMGFPFSDIYDAGVSVLVTTNDNKLLAESEARTLANEVWQRRKEFETILTPVREVVRYVREEATGLVVLADGSDNPGGGGPSDGTVILQALIEEEFEGAVVGILCDPETVEQAHHAGVGKTIAAVIGGKTDNKHGDPVHAQAYIRTLGDGEFTYRGPMGRGSKGHLGRTAVLVVGGTEVIVSEQRDQLRDAEMLRSVGIEPLHRKLLAVKSAVHFRSDLGSLAERIFDADTPGVHRPDLSEFKYERLRRPIYPIDPI